MITRKKRRMLIILPIVILTLVIIGILVYLYITTDLFKSNESLFIKYIGQNVENVENIYKDFDKSEYDNVLNENKYTSEAEIKVNYTKNRGTTLENTDNPINQLRLNVNGQTDKANNYNYQDIVLKNNNQNEMEIEYVQNDNTFGICFTDLFNQYVSANNENLRELLKNAGYSEEKIANIPNVINFNVDFNEIFGFSEDEKKDIENRYVEIIENSKSVGNFSKQSNQSIEIDGKNINANVYMLTLPKEKLNDLYINIFEELKQDSIILAKIQKLQEYLNYYNFLIDEDVNLEDVFTSTMQNMIDNVVKNNIGQDECKILVYESNGITVRTMIQRPEYEIILDLLSESEKYMQLSYKDMKNDEEQVCIYKNGGEQTNVTFKNTENEKTLEYNIVIDDKMTGDKYQKNVYATYEDEDSKVELSIDSTAQMVESFENQVALNTENSVNLSELSAEQVSNVIDKVKVALSEKIDDIEQNVISFSDLTEVLVATNFMMEGQIIEGNGVTEIERNRFNSQFEILQGENLDSVSILSLINAVKENFTGLEVVSATELRVKIDRFKSKEESFETLTDFVERNKDNKYNVKVEYDEENGLINGILLIMIDQE